MILLISSITLTVLIAVFTCINSWKHASEERYQNSNYAAIAVLVFTTLFQAGSFYSGFTAINEKNITDSLNIENEKENRALGDSLKISQSKIILLQNNLLDTTNKILLASLGLNQQQKNLNRQQQKLNQLQSELYNQVIGNDKGPSIYGNTCKETPNDIGLDLFNHSKYPTFEIRVNVTVLSYLRDFQPINYDGKINARSESSQSIYLGTMPPNRANLGFMITKLNPNIKCVTWGINLCWRNGSSNFEAVFERNNKGRMVVKSFNKISL